MRRHRAWLVQVILILAAVLSAAGCGVDSASLPPSPFLQRPSLPPPTYSESELRAALLRRLAQRLGPDAIDCGTFGVRWRESERAGRAARLERALACLHSESMRRRPARLVIQVQGIDTWNVNGLFTKSDGVIWGFDYHTDPFGERGPAMRSWPCPDPVPRDSEWAEFECRQSPIANHQSQITNRL